MDEGFRRYFEPTDGDHRWGLAINGVGAYHGASGDIDENGRSIPFHILAYVHTGRGTLFPTPGKTTDVGAGSIIRVHANVWHKYFPDPGMGWGQKWLIYSGWYADGLVRRRLFGPPVALLTGSIVETAAPLFHRLMDLGLATDPSDQTELRVKFFRLLNLLSYPSDMRDDAGRHPAIQRGIDWINQHWHEDVSIDQLAVQCGLSPSRFRFLFHRVTGMSPKRYLSAIRINEAKALLEMQKFTIQEVAHAVGFCDESYFSRLFRKRTGTPPSRWRPM